MIKIVITFLLLAHVTTVNGMEKSCFTAIPWHQESDNAPDADFVLKACPHITVNDIKEMIAQQYPNFNLKNFIVVTLPPSCGAYLVNKEKIADIQKIFCTSFIRIINECSREFLNIKLQITKC